MKKEDLVIGNKYHLEELEVELVGIDPEKQEVLLLSPLNAETESFYNLNKDGLISLSEWVFVECFNPQK